ncbi:hypothetical protein [Demequina litorisediminis]|uniref:Uncharacterized protein n=1 Tax=Demequina litorisediminis TaxID=1849022 RepID=A0ABQ6I7X8_9MICO|nr:hypothetical protein [Demequina litorisediminis]GMA33953.1 hypothetical protein GCM10025876_01570 [Demequina litorisediminis]
MARVAPLEVTVWDTVLTVVVLLLLLAPGMESFWPMRMEALEPRELALVMADTVVPYFLARSQTVSPAVTVWVPAAFVAVEPVLTVVVPLAPGMESLLADADRRAGAEGVGLGDGGHGGAVLLGEVPDGVASGDGVGAGGVRGGRASADGRGAAGAGDGEPSGRCG